ncbi:LPS export ABC transporter permease LptG [Dongia sp.]|jgi:lipopolysaccharide export system permease protein|uniref:LPS export ABC transporter permease LptG n=1 Tax=Dongia sp. TaxID=1977262 RepID=UPI0035B412A5
MNTFSRYVLKNFLWQFLLLLIGFTALLQLFDLLNNSADILNDHMGRISAVFEYAALRLPEITSFLVPFAVLMGALVTLGKMERNNEIMAYKAAGAPYFTVLWAFLPAVGIVAVLHFFLADRIVPVSIQTLIARDLTAERNKSKNEAKDEPLFVQEGNSVIEAGAVGQDGMVLSHLRIYERDAEGKIVRQIFADDAHYDAAEETWRLINVWTTVVPPDGAAQTLHSERWDWKSRLTPAEFSDLVEKPQAMTLGKIWGFISSTQVGVRPTYFYETWLQKRIALPVSSILMILLAAPVAHSLHRRERGLAMGMTVGFGLGFLYFLTDGLVLSLGESGAVPPFLAAWLPILLFAAIGGAWLIKQEGY